MKFHFQLNQNLLIILLSQHKDCSHEIESAIMSIRSNFRDADRCLHSGNMSFDEILPELLFVSNDHSTSEVDTDPLLPGQIGFVIPQIDIHGMHNLFPR